MRLSKSFDGSRVIVTMDDLPRLEKAISSSERDEFVLLDVRDKNGAAILDEFAHLVITKAQFDFFVDFIMGHRHKKAFVWYSKTNRLGFFCMDCSDGRNLLDNENAVIER